MNGLRKNKNREEETIEIIKKLNDNLLKYAKKLGMEIDNEKKQIKPIWKCHPPVYEFDAELDKGGE